MLKTLFLGLPSKVVTSLTAKAIRVLLNGPHPASVVCALSTMVPDARLPMAPSLCQSP